MLSVGNLSKPAFTLMCDWSAPSGTMKGSECMMTSLDKEGCLCLSVRICVCVLYWLRN